MSLIFLLVTSNAFAAVSRNFDGCNSWGVHPIVCGIQRAIFPINIV
jgi:hypothetical protein